MISQHSPAAALKNYTGVKTYQMRILELLDNLNVIQLDVEILIHAL
jgi:hypothetical protein